MSQKNTENKVPSSKLGLYAIIGLVLILGIWLFTQSQGLFGNSSHAAKKEAVEKTTTANKKQTTEETTEESLTTTEPEEEDTLGEAKVIYEAISFTDEKRVFINPTDGYQRPSSTHVQLKYADRTTGEAPEVKYDLKGWHNYQFKYIDANGKTKKAWLMEKAYLVGFQFIGDASNSVNNVPLTRYLVAGTISDTETDPTNPYCKLFYETALENWLKEHPTYTLDYQVVANYEKSELIPRSISLFWSGFDENGKQIKVELPDSGKATYDRRKAGVTLRNISKNAIINYETGEATPRYK